MTVFSTTTNSNGMNSSMIVDNKVYNIERFVKLLGFINNHVESELSNSTGVISINKANKEVLTKVNWALLNCLTHWSSTPICISIFHDLSSEIISWLSGLTYQNNIANAFIVMGKQIELIHDALWLSDNVWYKNWMIDVGVTMMSKHSVFIDDEQSEIETHFLNELSDVILDGWKSIQSI
jgi:hypothetical protein